MVRKYKMNITGVIHVGGHYGEEDNDYLNHGIRNRYYFEANPALFDTLVANTPGAKQYCTAIGSTPGILPMHVETYNQGQSSSLLKPGTHLKHYPLITFNEQIEVPVQQLDSFDITDCNFMNLDVQGYELEVLKGAKETLRHVDYVYTEVNTEDVYEGCGKLPDMDAFLSEFQRVETVMTGQGWGDALYIRRRSSSTQPVPAEFRPHHPMQYPSDNDLIFEEWYAQQAHPVTERIYLPVFWTSYYCKHKYGKDANAIRHLQTFLNSLDRSKKYYTILQYDDGILNDISHLDIKVFAACGNRIDYPLPLICKPHGFAFPPVKDIFCSYIGTNNHFLRARIMQYQHQPGWYISAQPHSLRSYCEMMARSKYVLCPRGYGATSFRIMEALQYGAIPVYISDVFILPHNYFEYGVLVEQPDEKLPTQLESITGLMPAREAFEKYFTYEANKTIIHGQLNK